MNDPLTAEYIRANTVKVASRLMPDAMPGHCISNVRAAAENNGGEIVTGDYRRRWGTAVSNPRPGWRHEQGRQS